MKKIVVLSGAGISQESGIPTFRDSNGLWENHAIEDVATPKGFARNPALVLDFYNQRRQQAKNVKPNAAHVGLAELELDFDVHIITQNVDNLHQAAGSSKVLHLHGELMKMRSVKNDDLLFECKGDIHWGDLAEDGGQLRPHIVWFGEAVPAIEEAITIASEADIFVVVGTSLQVYPAAGLLDFVPAFVPKYLIDPHAEPIPHKKNLTIIKDKASTGVRKLQELLHAVK